MKLRTLLAILVLCLIPAWAGATTTHDFTTASNEFGGTTYKASPVSADRILIEDSAGGTYTKAYSTVGGLPFQPAGSYLTAITGAELDAVFTGASGLLKKTGTATYTLDTSTYLTSLSGAVLTDQTSGQTVGDTTHRLTKLWATDITATNAIAGSVTGTAANITLSDTSDTRKFLRELSVGGVFQAPVWDTVSQADVSGLKTVSTPQFAGVKTAYVFPAADSTTAFQVRLANGSTSLMDFDTTGKMVGIGITPTVAKLHIHGAGNTVSTNGLFIENSDGNATLASRNNGDLYVRGIVQAGAGSNIIYYCNGGTNAGLLGRGNSGPCPGGSWVATSLKLD